MLAETTPSSSTLAPTDLPRRLLVTALCLGVLIGATWLPAPGQPRLLPEVSVSNAGISLGMLGVAPLMTGALLAAVLSWLSRAPAWRRAGPPGEPRLERWLPVAALAMAAVQALAIWRNLSSLGSQLLADPGQPWLVALSALGFTVVVLLLVAWNERAGVGNLVVLGAVGVMGWLMAGNLLEAGRLRWPAYTLVAPVAVVGFYVAAVMRWLRRPTAPGRGGFGAAYVGLRVGVMVLTLLRISDAWLDLTTALGLLDDAPLRLVVLVGSAAASALVLTAASVHPAALARVWGREGDGGVARVTALRATGIAAGLALAVWAWGIWDEALPQIDLVALPVLLAVGVDLWAELRARRAGPLVAVWSVYREWELAPLVEALSEAGVTVHVRGRLLLTLLSFLVPFAPARLLVAEAQAADALGLLRRLPTAS